MEDWEWGCKHMTTRILQTNKWTRGVFVFVVYCCGLCSNITIERSVSICQRTLKMYSEYNLVYLVIRVVILISFYYLVIDVCGIVVDMVGFNLFINN